MLIQNKHLLYQFLFLSPRLVFLLHSELVYCYLRDKRGQLFECRLTQYVLDPVNFGQG